MSDLRIIYLHISMAEKVKVGILLLYLFFF